MLMLDINPYQPSLAKRHSQNQVVDYVICATIQISAEFMVESLSRYRGNRRHRVAFTFLRIFGAFLFSVCAAAGLYMLNVWVVAFCLLFALLCIFPNKLDDLLTARRTRNSHRNGEVVKIQISDLGFNAVSDLQDVKLAWPSFTHWCRHDDGAMIFQGPKFFHWIPETSLSTDGDLDRLFSLLESKLGG